MVIKWGRDDLTMHRGEGDIMNDEKQVSKERAIRMAMKVAAVALGAGAAVMAATASEAKAGDAAEAVKAGSAEHASASDLQPLRVEGWSCWGPVSRGPAAPPCQADDFLALIDEVPE